MTTATIAPTHAEAYLAAQEKFRAALKTPRTIRFARAVPGEHPLETLRKFGAFTLYDFMTVANLGRAHALQAMHRAIADKQIEVTAEPGRYLVVKPPCRAIQVWTQCPPQFARNYIASFVHAQFQRPELISAVPALEPCPF